MCAPSPPSHISRSLSPHLSQCRARLAVLLSARSVIHRGFTRACEARPAPTDLGTVSTSVHKRDGLQIRLPPVPSRPVIMKIVRNEQIQAGSELSSTRTRDLCAERARERYFRLPFRRTFSGRMLQSWEELVAVVEQINVRCSGLVL
jgi:hypothetical protein